MSPTIQQGGWTVQPGLRPGVKDSDAVAVYLTAGMEWLKMVGWTPKDIRVTVQHCGPVIHLFLIKRMRAPLSVKHQIKPGSS